MLKEKERNLSFGMITLIIVLFLTVGYSAFERSLLLDDIALTVRPVEDIRVTGNWQTGSTNGAKSDSVDYNVKSSLLNIDLPQETSTITYTVQVTNIGNVDMGIYIITGLPKNMEYELTNYSLKEKICNEERCSRGIQKEFQITIKYKEGGYDSTNTKYELKLDYDFRRFYNVKYVNIEGEGYPDSVIEGDPLKVNFGDNVLGKITVKIGEQKTENYSYKDNTFEMLSINGDVEISATSSSSTGIYKEEILHGADPVLKGDLIPVTIDDDGTVHYANLGSEWYKYASKKWANAVILVGSPSTTYEVGDIIREEDIESYFVWIPRYKYKIWNTGDYTSAYQRSKLTDNETDSDTQLRHVTGNARLIEIVFESKDETPSSGSTVGSYLTHPAFTTLNVNGMWVGKFETGYNQNSDTEAPITTDNIKTWTIAKAAVNSNAPAKVIIKPNVYSWRNSTVRNIFFSAYNYNRTEDIETNLDSHMIKNTEWGAVAYLSHSIYGIGHEMNINNNVNRVTGYSAASNTDQTSYLGENGTEETVTQPYNTPIGYHASTTGNITGIYDMSGGSWEYVAGYKDGYGVKSSDGDVSGFSSADLTTYEKYFDKYSKSSNGTTYNYRILGDATGEMGPFYLYYDKAATRYYHNGWYADHSGFVTSAEPWLNRGGRYYHGTAAGVFCFYNSLGTANAFAGSRLVLTPQ